MLTHCRCANPPVCIRMHKNDHVRTLKILLAMSEFNELLKHEQTQHALYNELGLTVAAGFSWGKRPEFPMWKTLGQQSVQK